MNDFNLDRAIARWRRRTVAQSPTEHGDLEELQSGLLDRYDEFLLKGFAPEEAFREAAQRLSPEPAPAKGGGGLLANYLKVAWRNLSNRRWFNLTNYACLTIGIVTVSLAALYLGYETGYDDHLPNVDRKYRMGMNLRSQGYSMMSFDDYNGAAPEAQLKQFSGLAEVPGVERAVQFGHFPARKEVIANQRELIVEDLLETNTPRDFLAFFGWELLAGTKDAFINNPASALLTESEAERFFGTDWRAADPVGQTFRIDTVNYAIAGVIADVPSNTHFDFSVALHVRKINYWGARYYVELSPGNDAATVTGRINQNFTSINARLAENELFGGAFLQPVSSIHLGSDLLYELKTPGDIRYLYIIGFIALIILLLTITNYTNLSVVMNAGRAREVGMRKVFGASKGQIASQFLLEGLGLSLFTIPVAILLVWYLLPRFSALMGVRLDFTPLESPVLLLLIFGTALFVGLAASVYPAVFMARTQGQALLQKGKQRGGGSPIIRKGVITLQFFLLISLTSLTLFVNRQLTFIQQKDLGFTTENILYVNLNADSSRLATFRNEMLSLPEVTAVGSGDPMGQQPYNQLTYKLAGREEVFDDANNIYLDYQALAQMEVETSIQEYVDNPASAPERLVLINQTMVDKLRNRYNLSEPELIGQTLLQEPEYVDEETGQVGFPYPIGGTFGDMHMFSLRERVDPMFMTVSRNPRFAYWASISYRGVSPAEIVATTEAKYRELGFTKLFVHEFLENNLSELYVAERRIATLANVFSGIAYFMAIIGLVALTAYLTNLRKREIGIRSILGAKPTDILYRFNREYLSLLLIALAIAVPLTWWGVGRWLEGFAYRIDVDFWVFLVAGGVTLLLSIAAVSLVTVKAIREVPARVLTRNA